MKNFKSHRAQGNVGIGLLQRDKVNFSLTLASSRSPGACSFVMTGVAGPLAITVFVLIILIQLHC